MKSTDDYGASGESAKPAENESTETSDQEKVDTESLQAYVDGLDPDELGKLKEIVDAKLGSDDSEKKMTMADIMGGV